MDNETTESQPDRGDVMRRRALLALTSVVLFVVGAWLVETAVDRSVLGGEPYRVTLLQRGEVVRVFTVEELQALESKRIHLQGAWQEGPTLLTVLREAGTTEFERVVVVGAGARDSGQIELSRAQVDDEVLLDFANRGTVKLAGPEIPWRDRVRDVLTIEVW